MDFKQNFSTNNDDLFLKIKFKVRYLHHLCIITQDNHKHYHDTTMSPFLEGDSEQATNCTIFCMTVGLGSG